MGLLDLPYPNPYPEPYYKNHTAGCILCMAIYPRVRRISWRLSFALPAATPPHAGSILVGRPGVTCKAGFFVQMAVRVVCLPSLLLRVGFTPGWTS